MVYGYDLVKGVPRQDRRGIKYTGVCAHRLDVIIRKGVTGPCYRTGITVIITYRDPISITVEGISRNGGRCTGCKIGCYRYAGRSRTINGCNSTAVGKGVARDRGIGSAFDRDAIIQVVAITLSRKCVS